MGPAATERKVVWRPMNGSDSLPGHSLPYGDLPLPTICKGYQHLYPLLSIPEIALLDPDLQHQQRKQLLKVTGNILYDMNYRSRIDTPFAENKIYQHTVQTRLDILYKEQYPFKLYLTTRFGNSAILRKYTDLSLLYNKHDFERVVKQNISNAIERYFATQLSSLDSLQRAIKLKQNQIDGLSTEIRRPDVLQKLVEEQEAAYLKNHRQTKDPPGIESLDSLTDLPTVDVKHKLPRYDNLNARNSAGSNDGATGTRKEPSFGAMLADKQQRLTTLLTEVDSLRKRYSFLLGDKQLKMDNWRAIIQGSNTADIAKKVQDLKLPDTLLPKGYKTLFALQSVGIGRTMVDYSELSVRNINITGIQAEFSANKYYALAAGKVDYRFRDFIVPNLPRTHQYLAVGRVGKGTRYGNHLIFTYYTGKRQLFNSSTTLNATSPIPEYHLAGFTMEGMYKISRNIQLVGEVAKSTKPYYSLDSLQSKHWVNSNFSFKDRTNEAYSVKLFTYWPATKTRIMANYRYLGANFQSFSTFTTGSSQKKWMIRAEQSLWKNRVSLSSSVQQDGYNNPFVQTRYKTAATLASFSAILRFRKWPVISFGYYPSYQLTKVGESAYSESRYFTMIGNLSYAYRLADIQMNSYLAYSKFYNASSDSGFVYFNSRNILYSHQVLLNHLTVVGNYALSLTPNYRLLTAEHTAQLAVNQRISIGGGVKLIQHSLLSEIRWGYSGNCLLRIPYFGDVELSFDKGFIPGYDRQLLNNNMGRATYYKTF